MVKKKIFIFERDIMFGAIQIRERYLKSRLFKIEGYCPEGRTFIKYPWAGRIGQIPLEKIPGGYDYYVMHYSLVSRQALKNLREANSQAWIGLRLTEGEKVFTREGLEDVVDLVGISINKFFDEIERIENAN